MVQRNLLVAALLLALPATAAATGGVVHVLPYMGAITPVAAEYLVEGIETAQEEGAEAVVILLDTPGGLDASMRLIVKAELAADVPVIVYVSPSGSRAASAGVWITMAAHIAAMAPGTNIGSASPVSMMGGSMDSTMARKVTNDARAYLESIARQRGRNTDWAERFVVEAENIPAQRAVEENVVDLVADDLAQLLQAIDGRSVRLPQGERTLQTASADVERREMGLRQRLLAALVNPNVAYILMLLGFYGLFFELSNPGSLIPGILGGISLLLAFFAFQSLPTNYAGVALILLGIAMLILEVKVTSFGALTLGGLTSMALGSLLLFDTPDDWARLSWRVILPTILAFGGFFALCVWLVVRGQRRPAVTGRTAMIGETGRVLVPLDGMATGKVVVHGEVWDAVSDVSVEEGQLVEVTAIEGRIARVRPRESAVQR